MGGFLKKIVRNPVGAVKDVAKTTEKTIIRPIGGPIEKAAQQVGGIVESGAKGFAKTWQAFLKNPLPVIETVALTAGLTTLGIPPNYAQALSSAAVSAANGGNTEDIAKAALATFASTEFAQAVGPQVTQATQSQILGKIIASSAGAAAGAAITGQDIGKAAASGAFGANVKEYYDWLNTQPPAVIEDAFKTSNPVQTLNQKFDQYIFAGEQGIGGGDELPPTVIKTATPVTQTVTPTQEPAPITYPQDTTVATTTEPTVIAAGPTTTATDVTAPTTGLPPGTTTVPLSKFGAEPITPTDKEAEAIFGEGAGTETAGVTEATRLPFFEPGELGMFSVIPTGGGTRGTTVGGGAEGRPTGGGFGTGQITPGFVPSDTTDTGISGAGTTTFPAGGTDVTGIGTTPGTGGLGGTGAGLGGEGEGGMAGSGLTEPAITTAPTTTEETSYPVTRFPLPGDKTLTSTRLFTPYRTELTGLAPIERRKKTELTEEEGEPVGRWGSETLRGLLGI